MMFYPTPHGDKLHALLQNKNLPARDRPRVITAIKRYEAWSTEIKGLEGFGGHLVKPLVNSLNRYKMWVDLNLIFDSSEDFLYRQKGQLKIDNTILEEFLPLLVGQVFSDQLAERGLILGPANTFSQLHFEANLLNMTAGGGMAVRSKDHDFVIAHPLFLKSSHQKDFSQSREAKTHLAYVAAEIKTNLDKTMFQEASATAYDLKLALPNSQYFLLCEWLDMTPISTAVTAIEEVIVLRKAKRLAADVRKFFSKASDRIRHRDAYEQYLAVHPFALDAFQRFLSHIEPLLGTRTQNEKDILDRGWF